jgi:hypothetical protein
MWLQYCAAVALGAALAMLVTIPSLDPEAIRCGNDTTAESARALNVCYGSGRTLNVTQARDLYNCLLAGDNWQRIQTKYADTEICRRAKHLHSYRHAVRLYVRTRGSYVAQFLAQARDFIVYRNPNGPHFASLLEENDGNCSAIIQKAGRTNPVYNALGSETRPCHI